MPIHGVSLAFIITEACAKIQWKNSRFCRFILLQARQRIFLAKSVGQTIGHAKRSKREIVNRIRPVPLKTARWKCKSAARALSLSKLPPTARGSQRHTPPAPRTCVKQKDGKKCRPISYRTGLRSAVRSSLFCVSSCSVTPLCVPLLSASSPYDDRMENQGNDRYRDNQRVGCKRLAVPFHRV